ncbi:MAG TPA: anti-sigma factor [Microbacterium sp.]|nr:anti-sigma factor [Microbacterium sp.]
MTEEEFTLLAAGAALGALSDDDRRAYLRALAEHPEWTAVADEDAATAARLADLVDQVPPPPALRDRILAGLDRTPEDAPTASASTENPRRLRRGWVALAASVVLVLGIGIGTVIAVQNATRPAAVVALDRIEAAPDAQQATARVAGGGSATLHWSVSDGQAVLVTGRMPRLTDAQTFELWYVRGATPIPAGTFDATGDTTKALLAAGMHPGDVIAVTVEKAGGSSTGQPTTKPILAIPTT